MKCDQQLNNKITVTHLRISESSIQSLVNNK
ncbi:hypothetical protein N039_03810 [Staphylococcus sp. EGD-HP3]|nr:hypothetical protein N039_03810 [Staphylococcus sp. EGD-HP3]